MLFMVKISNSSDQFLNVKYNNVFWSNYETAWIGSYETASGRVLTAKSQESVTSRFLCDTFHVRHLRQRRC